MLQFIGNLFTSLMEFLSSLFTPLWQFFIDTAYFMTSLFQVFGLVLSLLYMLFQLIVSTGIGLITTLYNFAFFNPANIAANVGEYGAGISLISDSINLSGGQVLTIALTFFVYILTGFCMINLISSKG